jgi:VWFA-related protein
VRTKWRLASPAAVALGLACLTAGATARAQLPTFSSKVEVVRVDVLVTEFGRPIVGLRPSDFELRDNGVRQSIEFAALEKLPLKLILALDSSDSVAGVRLAHLQAACEAVLDRLQKEDEAALITFNHKLVLGSPFTSDLGRVRTALRAVAPGGQTALVDALYAGMVLGEAGSGRGLLVAFTDGADTSSFLRRQAVQDVAKSSDVVVYPVTSGRNGRRLTSFLRGIADQTGGRLFEVESTPDLQKTFVGILDEFRQRYVLAFRPQAVAKGGWHRLEVLVKGRPVDVRARAGYQGGQ